MAVGRRKRFGGGTLPTVQGTLFTAGTAPADGSAAATFYVTVCNTTGSSITFALLLNANYLYAGGLPGANAAVNTSNTLTCGPYDLMGGEILQGIASVSGVYWSAYGVEAKDN